MTESELKVLTRKRGTIKQKLTILEKFITTIKNSTGNKLISINEVDLRYKDSSGLLSEFDAVQSMIESMCTDEQLPSHFLEREDFHERYYAAQDFFLQYLQTKFRRSSYSTSSLPQQSTNSDPLLNVLIPKVKLPTFSGEFKHWINFKNNFESTVSSNHNLNENQKYQLLKASLEGYASRYVEGVDNSLRPFELAWELLCDRFDKKQFLVDSHFKSLLNIKSLHKENYFDFRKILDEICLHLTALDALNLSKEDLYDSFIIHVLANKFDKNTLREWKELKYQNDMPNLDEITNFLKNKSDVLQCLNESLDPRDNNNIRHKPDSPSRKNNNSHMFLSANNKVVCNYCKKENHTIYKCSEFLALPVDIRIQKVKALNLCENCLRTGHTKIQCKLVPCIICKNKKHNSLLHLNINNNNTPSSSSIVNTMVNADHNLIASPNQVLLSTITCDVLDDNGKFITLRALLDCGAQTNLITENCVKKLNIPLSFTDHSIIGINQMSSQLSKKCTIRIHSKFTSYNSNISCFVVPVIATLLPSFSLDLPKMNIPAHVHLSDPEFVTPAEIDLLLGANVFWDLLEDGKISLGKNMPTLHNTKLGWIVTGVVPETSNYLCNFSKVFIPEDEQLKKFWELEDISNKKLIMTHDDEQCEELFKKNTTRNNDGKFIVKYPLKHSPQLLGDSKQNAINRFKLLEKKFSNKTFKNLYVDFIHEYIQLGHMSEITNASNSTQYFLPHHGILKAESITTKLRTVFDGSSKSSSGWSLNDLQYIGPKVQNDIVDILMRFRIFQYVVSADICQMYRQILMHHEHKPLQQIIWRENVDDDFSIFQLNTVTYGTRSAPYLAIKCLKYLAEMNMTENPIACETILDDFFVDDLLTGSNDKEELKQRCNDIYTILDSAKFTLRKWVSNDPDIISQFEEIQISNAVLDLGDQSSCKTLGIQWTVQSDSLTFKIKQVSLPSILSKRYILSVTAQIYDPLGLISPVTILSKILIQNLWSLHISWDTEVPEKLKSFWINFQQSLENLNSLTIPRSAIPIDKKFIDIHCFCDASKDAYASCIYVRSSDTFGNYQVRLFCSKTKVAPLKSVTIPKLELCACLLGAELMKKVSIAVDVTTPIFMWSDSKVALSWIHTEPSSLQVFVSNRVAKIQSLTESSMWNYVISADNPADVASRGSMPEKLLKNKLWWDGPEFLKSCNDEWPITTFHVPKHELPELKKVSTIYNCNIDEKSSLFYKFSDLNKLHRVITQCIRFKNNTQINKIKRFGPLSVDELESGRVLLVKLCQQESFPSELKILKCGKFLEPKNRLSSLTPFLDENDIMRVGGRLKATDLPFHVKHPILLCSRHQYTRLLFEHKHRQLLHPGPQSLLFSMRQFYWPIGGLTLAKRTVKSCLRCFKFKPVPLSCPMSSLPNERVRPRLPFEIIGIDYAGPFFILNKKGRGSKLLKCYLSIFVCFCTKSIHIECITDLTTESFLACLKRFTARRGIPSTIYSDNGSTFVGASNQLRELGNFLFRAQKTIVDSTSCLNIKWKFIPPYTPNHGGLWESAVKSTKFHLKRTLLNNNVTFEEFNTLVIQIEGILNSRPLFAMSNDPNDLTPLSPSHFLIGRIITSIPDYDWTGTKTYQLTRFQHVQQMFQRFWQQFSKNYISQLHQQYKWKTEPLQLDIGTLVLIKNDHQPPCKWPTGRVARLFDGKDGVSRIAELCTPNGVVTRSVRHLCPLPLQDYIEN